MPGPTDVRPLFFPGGHRATSDRQFLFTEVLVRETNLLRERRWGRLGEGRGVGSFGALPFGSAAVFDFGEFP